VTEDVVISRPGYTLPSTLSLPASEGAAPCVVFFAGSGPTDRDWTSPLLPGKNGSGAQLALALQARGVGSIRFDKVGSGVNMPKSNAPADLKMLDVLSLAHYVDEAVAAFDELASRDRCGKIVLLGHSEGSIHASSAAIAKQADPRFGGFISLSGPARSILDTAIEQIRAIHIKSGSDAAIVGGELEQRIEHQDREGHEAVDPGQEGREFEARGESGRQMDQCPICPRSLRLRACGKPPTRQCNRRSRAN